MSTTTIRLITGATTGLGRETARRLIETGHTVVLTARDIDRGRRTADDLGAVFVPLDVTDPASVAAAATSVHDLFGRLDVLVNNAGVVGPRRPLPEVTSDEAAGTLDTNLLGLVRTTRGRCPGSWSTPRGPATPRPTSTTTRALRPWPEGVDPIVRLATLALDGPSGTCRGDAGTVDPW